MKSFNCCWAAQPFTTSRQNCTHGLLFIVYYCAISQNNATMDYGLCKLHNPKNVCFHRTVSCRHLFPSGWTAGLLPLLMFRAVVPLSQQAQIKITWSLSRTCLNVAVSKNAGGDTATCNIGSLAACHYMQVGILPPAISGVSLPVTPTSVIKIVPTDAAS